jgi:hypothetical protein
MCTKTEWKECAERRLAENLALRVVLNEIEIKVLGLLTTIEGNDAGPGPTEVSEYILDRVTAAKEVGR